MWTRWDDFEPAFALLDEMRRRMDRFYQDAEMPVPSDPRLSAIAPEEWTRGFPRMQLRDTGPTLVLRAEIPGMGEDDVQVSINQDVLTISGERKSDAPERYSVHRQERLPARFSRSLALACKIDLERTTAIVKDGLLTITLPKAPESQPRRISVQGQKA